jgi:hypothetical protein
VDKFIYKNINKIYVMDVLILAAGLGSRLSKFTHDKIPKYLINIDNNTGLYYIINYWSKYAEYIYLVINSKYNTITEFYIENILIEFSSKIKIINYDNNDGTAYTINYILNNNLVNANIKNLLITWCDLYPTENINFKKLNKDSKKNNNIFIFTYGNQCRYLLNDDNEIIFRENECDGNIIGIYYIQNYKEFMLDDNCKNNDIVSYLSIIGKVNKFEINNIVDYGDEEKLLKIYENINNTKSTLECRYFNNMTVVDDNKILKKGITDKGKEIIKYERNWYEYINSLNNCDINNIIPKIYNLFEFAILMEYKKDYIPIYKYFMNYENEIIKISDNEKSIKQAEYNINKITILKNIFNKINELHNIENKTITKIVFLSNIKKEIYDKLYDRKKIINKFINYFGEIKIVNGITISSFDEVIEKCKKIITQYYNAIDEFKYSIIFGDCQFSNILINPNNINDIIFIDPRGYFGESKIHGPCEYDYAKILYGISGYDRFNFNYFNIKKFDDSIKSMEFEIKGFSYEKKIINKYFNKIHKTFLVIIWLSLAEYNKNNIWKCLASYYYGLYLGTIL